MCCVELDQVTVTAYVCCAELDQVTVTAYVCCVELDQVTVTAYVCSVLCGLFFLSSFGGGRGPLTLLWFVRTSKAANHMGGLIGYV